MASSGGVLRGRAQAESSADRRTRHDYWGVVLDADDAHVLAGFYSDLLGWPIAKSGPENVALLPPDGVAYLAFQTNHSYVRPVWPGDRRSQQMMLHLDIEVDDLGEAVASAVETGAAVAEFQPRADVRVMLDPAGHPFCLYVGS